MVIYCMQENSFFTMDDCLRRWLECSLADTSIVFVGIAGSVRVRVMVRVKVSGKLVSAKVH